MMIELLFAKSPVDGVGAATPVSPGRSRTRTKEKVGEKVKGVPDSKKKSPSRKAPSRGRYVDEYARPPDASHSTPQHTQQV